MTVVSNDRRRVLRAALPALAAGTLPLHTSAQGKWPAEQPRAFGVVEGRPSQAAELRSLALLNYGHFTTVQVQGRAARGLDFQVARLQRSTRELFKSELSETRIREQLRLAIEDNNGLVLARVNVFPTGLDWMNLGKTTPVALLITQSPLATPAHTPQRVRTARYERVLPQIKHVGTFGLFHYRREAQMLGFDDALFFDSHGSITEGTTWNVAFHDGRRFVLPNAPALPGGAIHLLRAGMRKLGVPFVEQDVKLADLRGFRSALLTNVPLVYQPILRIDDVDFEFPQELHATLQACYATNLLVEV